MSGTESVTACADVTSDMADEHYGESAADAKPGDLLWHPKMEHGGHVLSDRTQEATYGWVTVEEQLCECGHCDLTDHHVVILARRADS
jgi:hypothetical protein